MVQSIPIYPPLHEQTLGPEHSPLTHPGMNYDIISDIKPEEVQEG